MGMPGYVFKDGGPIPDSDMPQGRVGQGQPGNQAPALETPRDSATSISTMNTPPSSGASEGEAPSDSHALAMADHDEKGAAQRTSTEGEVTNLGWHDHPDDVDHLVGGLDNEDLWTLIRRFNKQMYHVKATEQPLLGGLDLSTVEEDEFSPDKLRSNVERLYMTVIIGFMGFGKHIARIRSWREPRRTAGFLAAYVVAWIFSFVIPLILTTVIVLITYPPSRAFLFPPAPLALVDASTGGVKSPSAGVLGSHDSATGAPEKHKGEAVEQEASNFVSGIGHIALSSAAGKHEQGDPDSDPLNKAVPDPTHMAVAGAEAKSSAGGGSPTRAHDKTKQPMEEAMWGKMRPIMHVVGDTADGWERFANALSPTPPFPQEQPRLILASVLVPIIAASMLTTPAMLIKGTSFFTGFAFFSDPLIWRGLDFLNTRYPNWQKLLEIRNSLLKGVPTNAQLTITLLRIGEANKAPIPPAPSSDQPPPHKAADLSSSDLGTLDHSQEELHSAIHESPEETAAREAATEADQQKASKKHGSRILGFFRGTANAGVQSKLSLDVARAKIVRSKHARNHLGVLPRPGEVPFTGPIEFRARYQGHKGWVFISTSSTNGSEQGVSTLSFTRSSVNVVDDGIRTEKHVWEVPITEIVELKKVGGLGWKAKLVVGWATGRQVADGLEIVRKGGERWKVTAVGMRDELFNRLASMGGQRWESY